MGSLGGLGGQQSLMGGMAPIACGSIRPNSGKLRPRSGAATGRSVYRPMSGRRAVCSPTTPPPSRAAPLPHRPRPAPLARPLTRPSP